MSQKKQNLMARRIEMRRRKEEYLLRELQASLHVETDDGLGEEHDCDEILHEDRHYSKAPQHAYAHRYEAQIRQNHDSIIREELAYASYKNKVPTQQSRDYTLADDAGFSRARLALATERKSGQSSDRSNAHHGDNYCMPGYKGNSYVPRNLTYNRDAVQQSGIMRSHNQAGGNIGRTISQFSSPSDEWHGYGGRHDQLASNQSNFEPLRCESIDEMSECCQQKSRSGSTGRQRTAQSIGEMPQQPNWKDLNDAHQDLNRRRLHRRQLARRQPQNQQSMIPQRSPQPAAFSPVEYLSSRTDQIKRRSLLPTSAPADRFPSFATRQDNCECEGDESIVSVTDQARKIEQTNANNRRANFAMRRRRSRSLSREKSKPSHPADQNQKRYPAYLVRQHAQSHRDHFVDEEIVSVASIRKEWEIKSTEKSSSRHDAHQLSSQSAFGAWEEREGRVSRQRRRDQRRAQQRHIEDRWRRSASRSLPPPERRANRETLQTERRYESIRNARYQDGYQSEGHAREPNEQYEYVEVDSSPITLQDARHRLWDQKERLRAVLPRDDADHIDDAQEHIDCAQNYRRPHRTSPRPSDVVSPSNFSESSGGRFKSKFVHAAAVAAACRPNDGDRVPKQQARQVEQQRHVPQRRRSHSRSPKKSRPFLPKEVAVSCQYTDSTADTTATTAPHSSFNSSRQGFAVRTSSSGDVERQSSVKSNIPTGSMPSIAETSQARSVADLIAKINAVSRSDPAQALAAIDSIIQREKIPDSRDDAREIRAEQEKPAMFSPTRPVSDVVPSEGSRPPTDIGPIKSQVSGSGEAGGKYFQEKYEEIISNLARAELDSADDPGLEEEGDEDGSWSSDETTVSSMTNPTYQSLHDADSTKRSRIQATTIKQAKSWNTIKNEYAARKSRSPPSVSHGEMQMRRQESQGRDADKSGPGSLRQRDKKGPHASTQIPYNHQLSLSKSESYVDKSRDRQCEADTPSAMTDGSAWVSVPRAGCFANQQENRGSVTSNTSKRRSTPPHFAGMPELISPRSPSLGDLAQSPSEGPEELMRVVSSAFSDIDIPLEEGPVANETSLMSIASRRQEGRDVVRDRRQELEFLAKSWTADNSYVEKDEQSRTADQSKNSVPDSTSKPKSILRKAKSLKTTQQPAIRLKGNQSLAKKFAHLAHAFQ